MYTTHLTGWVIKVIFCDLVRLFSRFLIFFSANFGSSALVLFDTVVLDVVLVLYKVYGG